MPPNRVRVKKQRTFINYLYILLGHAHSVSAEHQRLVVVERYQQLDVLAIKLTIRLPKLVEVSVRCSRGCGHAWVSSDRGGGHFEVKHNSITADFEVIS